MSIKNIFLSALFALTSVMAGAQATQGPSGTSTPFIRAFTVAGRPAATTVGRVIVVSDGNAAGDCTVGGGSTIVLCRATGAVWAALGDGNSGGAPGFDAVTGGTNTGAAMIVGSGGSLRTTAGIFGIPNSVTLPATCTVGDAYSDNDAAAGARWNLCTATNTWTAMDNPFGASIGAAEVDADVATQAELDAKLALAGGVLTGLLTTDNLGIEFDESDTNPTCAAGNYNLFADLSETTLKACKNGTASEVATANQLLNPAAVAADLIPDGNSTRGLGDVTHFWGSSFISALNSKIDRNNTAVDDDDCTGEQGLWWYDTTDSRYEFCNANSGVPTVIPAAEAITAGDSLTRTGDDIDCDAMSTTVTGCVEAAIASEVDTGTDAARAVTPSALAGSKLGFKDFQILVTTDFTTNTAIADGNALWYLPSYLNGWRVIGVEGHVATVGTTNATNFDIAVCRAVATGSPCSGTVADLLSTNGTIDSNEDGTETAATPLVIDTANDDLATGDALRFDIDAISTTPAKGLSVVIWLGI